MDIATTPQLLLEPGRNCWRIERSDRTSFLVDGEEYFRVFRQALACAHHSILIAAWELHGDMRLTPEPANDGLPDTLGAFLNALVQRNRQLHIHLLVWDFPAIYAFDRQWRPFLGPDWRNHRRVHFRYDDRHPPIASHHQKIVVVDDCIALAGGIDPTKCRWDSPQHLPDDLRRAAPNGAPCPPFHDVAMRVEGRAAAALGDLVRERWAWATGETLPRPKSSRLGTRLADLRTDLVDVDIAIARTYPAYDGLPQVQEIKQLYIDAIEAARCRLYIENQYFCSSVLGPYLARRLSAIDPPEVCVVTRSCQEGVLEKSAIGVLEVRLDQQLRAADRLGRYRLYFPDRTGLGERFINVHSKLMIVDDDFLTLGSANFNNRSLGLDSECNLAIAAYGDECIRQAIAGLRHRLLAEHLGSEPQNVAAVERREGSLIAAIERLKHPARSLEPFDTSKLETLNAIIPETEVLDPELPLDPEKELTEYVPPKDGHAGSRHLMLVAGALGLLLALAAAWRWGPLAEWFDTEKLTALGLSIRGLPGAPLIAIAGYVLAGFMVLPVTMLMLATLLVFGPWEGLVYALLGAELSAGALYWTGRSLGHRHIRGLAGSRMNRLSRRLGKRGFAAIVAARVIPFAPFSVVNLVAGASNIGARDYFLGTLVGMAPGAIGLAVFVETAGTALRQPNWIAIGVLLGSLAMLVALAWKLKAWAHKHASG